MAVGVGIGGIPTRRKRRPPGEWIDTEPWYNPGPSIPGYDDIAAQYGTNPGFDPNAGLNFPPGSSGGVPSYDSILASDPYFNQLQKDLMAQSVADAASRDAARKRALIQFGEVPEFSNSDLGLIGADFRGVLTPEVAELIRQNTNSKLSTVARLQQADVEARRGIGNALNARGTYNSGELGYQMGNEQTDYLRSQYDARNNLIDALAGYNNQYLQAERERQMMLSQAALDAFLRGQYDSGSSSSSSSSSSPATTDPSFVQSPQLPFSFGSKRKFGSFSARPM